MKLCYVSPPEFEGDFWEIRDEFDHALLMEGIETEQEAIVLCEKMNKAHALISDTFRQ